MKHIDTTGNILINIQTWGWRNACVQVIKTYFGYGHFIYFAGLRLGHARLWLGWSVERKEAVYGQCLNSKPRQSL